MSYIVACAISCMQGFLLLKDENIKAFGISFESVIPDDSAINVTTKKVTNTIQQSAVESTEAPMDHEVYSTKEVDRIIWHNARMSSSLVALLRRPSCESR